MSAAEVEDLHSTLEAHLPTEIATEVKRMLYGKPSKSVQTLNSILKTQFKPQFL